MGPQLPRRLGAGVIGTFLLVFFGAGSVAAALRLGDGEFTPGSVVGIVVEAAEGSGAQVDAALLGAR